MATTTETDAPLAPDAAPADQPEKRESFWKSLAIFAVAAWALRSFVVASFSIPSGSMLPTMYIGDYLFVSKWPYGYSQASMTFGIPPFSGRIFSKVPERGDIVVFVGPAGQDVVKRVIGLPGDMIAVENGQVMLNGKPIPRTQVEEAGITVSPNSPCRRSTALGATQDSAVADGQPCRYVTYRETLPNGRSYLTLDQAPDMAADNFGAVVVPQDSIFMMGDNRDDSLDSRFSPAEQGMGFVPMDRVVGRAQFVFWSTDGTASWINPISWFTALRTDRIGTDYTE